MQKKDDVFESLGLEVRDPSGENDELPQAKGSNILDLRRKWLWLLLCITILLIAGAVGGGVGGSVASSHKSSASSEYASPTDRPDRQTFLFLKK